MSKKEEKESLFCSFCGKSQKEVKKLIAGPTVFVCDECVELCLEIIKEYSKNNKKKRVPLIINDIQIYFLPKTVRKSCTMRLTSKNTQGFYIFCSIH